MIFEYDRTMAPSTRTTGQFGAAGGATPTPPTGSGAAGGREDRDETDEGDDQSFDPRSVMAALTQLQKKLDLQDLSLHLCVHLCVYILVNPSTILFCLGCLVSRNLAVPSVNYPLQYLSGHDTLSLAMTGQPVCSTLSAAADSRRFLR